MWFNVFFSGISAGVFRGSATCGREWLSGIDLSFVCCCVVLYGVLCDPGRGGETINPRRPQAVCLHSA